jgi:hypothetical protein
MVRAMREMFVGNCPVMCLNELTILQPAGDGVGAETCLENKDGVFDRYLFS